jgi:hypothetical protein
MRGVQEVVLNWQRLEALMEGLQNLYTWVRFPPAPPSLRSFATLRISPAGSRCAHARKTAQVRFSPAPPGFEVLRYAQDFACGLPLRSRPQNGSSSIPTRASRFEVLRYAQDNQSYWREVEAPAARSRTTVRKLAAACSSASDSSATVAVRCGDCGRKRTVIRLCP